MAGGPYAAIVPCLRCNGKAVRTLEGSEDDYYRCEVCGHEFGIDWTRGQPQRPFWPGPRAADGTTQQTESPWRVPPENSEVF